MSWGDLDLPSKGFELSPTVDANITRSYGRYTKCMRYTSILFDTSLVHPPFPKSFVLSVVTEAFVWSNRHLEENKQTPYTRHESHPKQKAIGVDIFPSRLYSLAIVGRRQSRDRLAGLTNHK